MIAVQNSQGAQLVSIRGDVDLATAPGLRELLIPILEQADGPVVVDLSEVPFMDSTGVHVLVDAHQRLEAQNRQLAIACCEHGQVHRLLALVGLLDLLNVHRSRVSAVTGANDLIRSSRNETSAPYGLDGALRAAAERSVAHTS